MKLRAILFSLLFSSLFFTSCDKDDPDIENEEELITTLNYSLTSEDGVSNALFTFDDLDGDGADEPIISTMSLQQNTTYSGSLELLNKLESPAEDITLEVEEEAAEHQFFFETDVPGLVINYSDEDESGFPIGLTTSLTTAGPATGTLKITLIHEPAKDASGVAEGNIANAGGEADIAVTFNIDVQ